MFLQEGGIVMKYNGKMITHSDRIFFFLVVHDGKLSSGSTEILEFIFNLKYIHGAN